MARVEGVPPAVRIPVWEPYVTVTLSREEAQALYDVTGTIGGDADTTRRKHFSDTPDSIREVLKPYVVQREAGDKAGSIYFKG